MLDFEVKWGIVNYPKHKGWKVIISNFFLKKNYVFLFKMVRKEEYTKSQPKKIICEIVNFGSIKLLNHQKISKNTTRWQNIFIILL